jgi:DNA-binding CsgD family transcriptional regulator
MPAHLSQHREADVPIRTGTDSFVDLLRMLIQNLPRSDNWPQQPCETEEILVDMELDGARYLVVRLPKPVVRIQLSPREQEIVRMVAEGHPNKVIAGVLSISCWTVGTHLRRIFAKLRVNTRAAMVARIREINQIRE